MSSRKRLSNGELRQAMDWLFDPQMFAGLTQHGNADWKLWPLTILGLLWSWGGETALTERFQAGIKTIRHLLPDFEPPTTYPGFVKSLARWTEPLLPLLKQRLRERMQQIAQTHAQVHGWNVMAVDGTRIETPRTTANIKHFARIPPKRRRKRQQKRKSQRLPAAPQAWLTVVWHVGQGLLWDWRQGPTGASERTHLQDMLSDLPDHTLLVADAGFQGHDLLTSLQNKGISFVIRAGGNVRLLKKLGHIRRQKNIVAVWPDAAQQRGHDPIMLRLVEFRDGRQSVWLVTNVLDPNELSARQLLDIYRLRWGVEVFFRGLKQTFGRSKLRSHAPQNVEMELDWSLIAIWSLGLLAVRELGVRGRVPADFSLASCLKIIRRVHVCAGMGIDIPLGEGLSAVRDDGYARRLKAIRVWPHKKKTKPPSKPNIRNATQEEINTAKKLHIQAI